MRRRRTRYRFGRRRRRRGAVTVGALIALVAVLGIVAVVMAQTGGAGRQVAGPVGSQVGTPHRSGRSAGSVRARGTGRPGADAPAAQRRRESRAISDVLRYTPFIAAGTGRRRLIALSFDDGPSPYTPAVIRVLVRMRVPATFFVVGQQLTYFASALRAELANGFDVGDHTQNHAWLIRLGAAAQYAQISLAAHAVERIGAPAPRLFRPPYGEYDRRTLTTLRRVQMLMVLWSIDPGDWRRPGVKAIVANVLANSRPGAIVIMHDGGGDRSQTVAALPAIIRGLRHRGYSLVSVPELIKLDPPPRHQRLPALGGA